MSFDINTQRDFQKQLQYVVEGTTASTFGNGGGTDPSFTQAGRNPRITNFVKRPEGVEIRQLGSAARADNVKVFEAGELSFTTTITHEDQLKWFFNAPSGAGTCEESRTYLFSKNIGSTEYYRVCKGCSPISARLSITKRGLVELDATIFVADASDEVTSHGLTGTPVFATAITDSPWTHDSGSTTPLTIDSVAYNPFSLSLNTTWNYAYLDNSGSTKVLYSKPVSQAVNVDFDVAKKDALLSADGAALTKTTASYTIASGTTATFTNFQIQESGETHDQDSSDAVIESYSAVCDTVAIA